MNLQEAVKLAFFKGYRVTEEGQVISPHGVIRKLHTSPSRKTKYFSFKIGVGGGNRYSIPVHKLVSFQKFGDASFKEGVQTRHLDCNSLNNRWENIDIGTALQNWMDIPEGERILRSQLRSQKAIAARRKFTQEEVEQIRQEHESGIGYEKLKNKWGGSKSTFSYILSKTAKRKALY